MRNIYGRSFSLSFPLSKGNQAADCLFTKGQTGLHIDFQFKTFPIRPHCPWRISNHLTWGLGGNSREVSKDTANSPISSKIHKLLTPWCPALPAHHSHLGSFHKLTCGWAPPQTNSVNFWEVGVPHGHFVKAGGRGKGRGGSKVQSHSAWKDKCQEWTSRGRNPQDCRKSQHAEPRSLAHREGEFIPEPPVYRRDFWPCCFQVYR